MVLTDLRQGGRLPTQPGNEGIVLGVGIASQGLQGQRRSHRQDKRHCWITLKQSRRHRQAKGHPLGEFVGFGAGEEAKVPQARSWSGFRRRRHHQIPHHLSPRTVGLGNLGQQVFFCQSQRRKPTRPAHLHLRIGQSGITQPAATHQGIERVPPPKTAPPPGATNPTPAPCAPRAETAKNPLPPAPVPPPASVGGYASPPRCCGDRGTTPPKIRRAEPQSVCNCATTGRTQVATSPGPLVKIRTSAVGIYPVPPATPPPVAPN
jgi:hypothetical protein